MHVCLCEVTRGSEAEPPPWRRRCHGVAPEINTTFPLARLHCPCPLPLESSASSWHSGPRKKINKRVESSGVRKKCQTSQRMWQCINVTTRAVNVCQCVFWVFFWLSKGTFFFFFADMDALACLSELHPTQSVPARLFQRLQMINDSWHKHKRWEAQTERDRWRQIEAEGEAQVKYPPRINMADPVDNRNKRLPSGLRGCNSFKGEWRGETLKTKPYLFPFC